MNFKTLVDKISDGIKLILVQPTLFFVDKIENITPIDEHIVTDFEAGRPDMIALKHYGDVSKTDLILKFNGISDPFSINSGDTVLIPPMDIRTKKLDRIMDKKSNNVRMQFNDTKRLSQKDASRLDAIKKKYGKDEILPPNVIKEGKSTFKFTPGRVIFGAQAQSDPVAKEVERSARSSRTNSNR